MTYLPIAISRHRQRCGSASPVHHRELRDLTDNPSLVLHSIHSRRMTQRHIQSLIHFPVFPTSGKQHLTVSLSRTRSLRHLACYTIISIFLRSITFPKITSRLLNQASGFRFTPLPPFQHHSQRPREMKHCTRDTSL